MTIVEILTRENGSRNIQSHHDAARVWEDSYIEVPSHLGVVVWATYGRHDLHIEEGRLVGVTPTGWPPEPGPKPELPSVEERVAALEEALAQTDETAIASFESQTEQESINTRWGDALLDIYEMLGG